jgi:hypothetical protein
MNVITTADMPKEWQMKSLVQRYLSEVTHRPGETIAFGWFIFRILEAGTPPEVESLDFKEMASFTTNFSAADRVRDLQFAALCRCQVNEEPCNFMQTALVSRSYSPDREDAFLERQTRSENHDAGWYVGVLDEQLDLDDPDSFELKSLYEISIRDGRAIPYWLLPVGTTVILATGDIQIQEPNQAAHPER